MDPLAVTSIAVLLCIAAALYSSVGHGGASAYLAILTLHAVPIATMRPTALALNLLVAGVGTVRYVRAGQYNGPLFVAFALTAIPLAFVGGTIELAPEIYRPLLGIVLWLSAVRLLWRPGQLVERPERPPPPLWVTLPVGAAIGLLAGLTGTGGGIFLSPLILLIGWEVPRRTSGVAAMFILANSAAGLAGNLSSMAALPAELPIFVGAAGVGGLFGTWLGVARLPAVALLRLLGIVLIIAGAKLLFT